jgi:hypothetical protein
MPGDGAEFNESNEFHEFCEAVLELQSLIGTGLRHPAPVYAALHRLYEGHRPAAGWLVQVISRRIPPCADPAVELVFVILLMLEAQMRVGFRYWAGRLRWHTAEDTAQDVNRKVWQRVVCPTRARKLLEWKTPSDFRGYVQVVVNNETSDNGEKDSRYGPLPPEPPEDPEDDE